VRTSIALEHLMCAIRLLGDHRNALTGLASLLCPDGRFGDGCRSGKRNVGLEKNFHGRTNWRREELLRGDGPEKDEGEHAILVPVAGVKVFELFALLSILSINRFSMRLVDRGIVPKNSSQRMP
jgi:hypothetical protein